MRDNTSKRENYLSISFPRRTSYESLSLSHGGSESISG